MKTVLLSTSNLWNCGDDFIREGLLELLQLKPDVRVLWWNRGYGIGKRYANDLKVNLPLVDYFIVAGTPQWVLKNEEVYRYCLKKKIPLSIIGVGTRSAISKPHVELMQKVAASGLCEIALARDPIAYQSLIEFGFEDVDLMLDPAFFMRPLINNNKLNILCWRYQYSYDFDPYLLLHYPHKLLRLQQIRWLDRRKSSKLRQLYDACMVETFANMPEPKIVIVHDNREINIAEKLFGVSNVFYATDYRDIFKRYSTAKAFVGSRLHGAIPAIIHGASTRLIYTESRAQALEVAIDILGSHVNNIDQSIKVTYWDEGKVIDMNLKSFEKDEIKTSIEKAKAKIRNILITQPILHGLMRM
jgi:polysaccharide pyruvyl transferase